MKNAITFLLEVGREFAPGTFEQDFCGMISVGVEESASLSEERQNQVREKINNALASVKISPGHKKSGVTRALIGQIAGFINFD